jgi:hypothetical protein
MKTMLPYGKSINLHVFVNQLYRLILIFSFTLFSPSVHLGLAYQEEPAHEAHLDRFDIMTDTSGWVLIDQQLFWTSDAGQSWREISPYLAVGLVISDFPRAW